MMAKEGNAGSKQARNSTAQASNCGRIDPRSNPKSKRPGNASFLTTSTLPVGRSRKRPAENSPRSESNKRHMASHPRVSSPSTAKGPEKYQTATRTASSAFDDIANPFVPSSLSRPPVGSGKYTSGSPPSNTRTPSRCKHFVPRTEPVRKKPEFIDLTGDISPLARRSNKPPVVVDLTDDDSFTISWSHQEGPRQATTTSLVSLNHRTALEPTTPPRSSSSATSLSATLHNNGMPNRVSGSDVPIGLSRQGAFSQETVAPDSKTRHKGSEIPKNSSEEAPAVPTSHERPAPVSKDVVGPTTPRREATSDRSVAAEASNVDKRLETVSHHGTASIITTPVGETSSAPKSDGGDILAKDGQSPDQGEESPDDFTNNNDDDSDEEYLPYTPSRRSRARRHSRQRLPRPARRTRVVILRALSERARQFLVRLEQRPDLPIGDSCFFLRLPLEVRQQIYRHLLRARVPIQVLHGWSRLARVQQPRMLQPAILAVSRPVFGEAVRVLYAENKFRYKVRDTQAGKVVHVPGARTIAVENYAHYFRRLELHVDNRTGPEYGDTLTRALDILKDNGASLYKLTIDVSPHIEEDKTVSMTGWFDQGGTVNAALKALSTCFIQIHLTTPSTDSDTSKSLRCIIDKRSEVSELEVFQRRCQQHDGSSPGLGGGEERRRSIQTEQADKANGQLDQLSSHMTYACGSPELAIQEQWFEPFEATRDRPDYAGQEGPDDSNDEDYIYVGA